MEQNPIDNMQIKKLELKDLNQFNDLLRYAFQITEEHLLNLGWRGNEIRQSKFPILKHSNVVGWFHNDKLVSQVSVYPLKMNIHGSIFDIGFLTGVSTYPEYSGLGLMSSLLKRSLTEMKENGQSISLLYPYSIPLYRKKGWEIISDKMTFCIKDFQIPQDIAKTGQIERVDENSKDLRKLHDKFARKTHGCIFRSNLAWDEYWRWDVDDTTTAIYYNDSGEAEGYIVYLIKDEVFHIKEIVNLNTEAWNNIWNYIAAHESMVTEVKGNNYSNHAVAFWFHDSEIKETIQPYVMARIVDLAAFLNQYKFANCSIEKSITFSVSDPFLEWNNRDITVEFSKTSPPKITKTPSTQKVELSIGILATLFMGYKSPAYLHKMGYLHASDKSIRLLERIIPREKAYISDYI